MVTENLSIVFSTKRVVTTNRAQIGPKSVTTSGPNRASYRSPCGGSYRSPGRKYRSPLPWAANITTPRGSQNHISSYITTDNLQSRTGSWAGSCAQVLRKSCAGSCAQGSCAGSCAHSTAQDLRRVLRAHHACHSTRMIWRRVLCEILRKTLRRSCAPDCAQVQTGGLQVTPPIVKAPALRTEELLGQVPS